MTKYRVMPLSDSDRRYEKLMFHSDASIQPGWQIRLQWEATGSEPNRVLFVDAEVKQCVLDPLDGEVLLKVDDAKEVF